ncbi:MAG: hypothetical protein ACRD96_09175 [Bryobacteraceae bacterium]
MNRVGLLILAAASLSAWEEKLTREGAYWVQTVTGSEAVSPGGRLRITTRGMVAVKGGEGAQVRYTFAKKVRARSEKEARALLGGFVVQSHRAGNLTTVGVQHASESADSAEMQVEAPRGVREVFVETHGGAVEAQDLAGALQAHTGGGRIRLDRIGGSVFARTAGGEIHLGTMGGAVKCVSAGGPIRAEAIRGAARFETAGGDIVVREVGGPVEAMTAGGGIQIGKAGSTVNVNTVGGAIEIGSAAGMVTAESEGGPIQVSGAQGVHCETSGGAIRLTNVTGRLRASTTVGNVIARLMGAAEAGSFLSTGAGDITLFVPSNLRITIQAQNEAPYSARRIVSDFPVVLRRDGAFLIAEGSINGGGPVLRLAGAGGTITIKRIE